MRRMFFVLMMCLPLFSLAQQELEIIALRHRTVDQVLPVLQPLVEPGGALSGMNDQIILRASRANRAQIRQVLASIDQPARMLMIHVAQNRDEAMSRGGAQAYGRIESGNVRVIQPSGNTLSSGSRVEIRQGDSVVGVQGSEMQASGSLRSEQSVRVVEGGRAYINVGKSVPLPMRQMVRGPGGVVVSDSVVYRDVGQGFYAEPHLAGERVTLEIGPQFDTSGNRGYGSVNTQNLSTTVSGRLGEWIELGGVNQQSSSQVRGNWDAENSQGYDNRSIWLLVEEVR